MAIIGDCGYWPYTSSRSVRLYTDGCVVDSGTGLMGPCNLNTSLQELFTVIESSGGILLEELKTALGSTVSNLVPYNLQRVVESHNSCLYMSITKVLVILDCTRREGRDFLEDLVKSLQTDEELKKLLTALSKWISAFEDHFWKLALSKE